MTSVVVVGGGIAGYTAAMAARRDGANVTVVARAPGASALYAGGMEIVDDLDAILTGQPHHPFARVGIDAVGLATELDNAVTTLQVARISTNDPNHLRVEIRSRPLEWLERSCASGAEIVASPAAAVGGGRKPVWAPPEVRPTADWW